MVELCLSQASPFLPSNLRKLHNKPQIRDVPIESIKSQNKLANSSTCQESVLQFPSSCVSPLIPLHLPLISLSNHSSSFPKHRSHLPAITGTWVAPFALYNALLSWRIVALRLKTEVYFGEQSESKTSQATSLSTDSKPDYDPLTIASRCHLNLCVLSKSPLFPVLRSHEVLANHFIYNPRCKRG